VPAAQRGLESLLELWASPENNCWYRWHEIEHEETHAERKYRWRVGRLVPTTVFLNAQTPKNVAIIPDTVMFTH
jgi:hypothetical protein